MYGRGSSLRYFIGFALTIILLIFVIVLIVNHGSSKGKVPVTQKALTSYASDDNAAVRETIDGPINAEQNHNELQITVTNATTSFQLMQGYDGTVSKSQLYPMGTTSFDVFLSALDHAGFTKGDTTASLQDDRGFCPTGDRYIFEVMDNGNDVERFWTTSCGTPRTYKGNTALTLTLFQAQVPNYNDLTANTVFDNSLF
jgi:hypothetical protein